MTHQALDREFLSLLDKDARVRVLATGFAFTEGPIWHPKDQYLLFSDIPPGIRRRWDGNRAAPVLAPSNMGNGMTYDRALNLLVCEHATSSVTRFSAGRREVLASHFAGKELNSPNDITVADDGAIWFTDPTYGRMPVFGVERPCQLDFRGVYRVLPGGPLELVVEKSMFTQPNGLCFSPDEKLLYVNDTEQANIRVFDVEDGKLKNVRIFASDIADEADPSRRPDGMKCDALGNIWCTGPEGLWVFASDGRLLGKVAVPEVVANLHWGGDGWRTLFITASTSLYALETKVGTHKESFMHGYI
jgi:gluconolactonase